MAIRNTLIFGLFGTFLVASSAHADTLFGFYAGAGVWQQSPSGDVRAGESNVDLEDDLDLDRDTNNLFYARLEHGVPVLPNLRVNYSDVTSSGRNTLDRTIEFDDRVYTVTQEVSSKIDLSQSDAVLYYEVLDNIVSLDLGVAARWVDGYIEVASAAESTRVEFEGVLPMLYGRAQADLPFTGWWLAAELMGVAYDGDELMDGSAQLGWESSLGLGFEIGYRTMRLELDEFDDVDDAEIEINGPYAALNFHF